MLALVDLNAPCRVDVGIEDPAQKRQLQRPSSLSGITAVAARHGVVEPTVRGAGINLDGVAFVVAVETVAKSAHIVERDEVVGLTKNAEDGAFDALPACRRAA